MAKFLMPSLFSLSLFVCGAYGLNSHAKKFEDVPIFPTKKDTTRSYILILNAFDLNGQKMRKNKKELFADLLRELKSIIEIEVNKRVDGKTEIVDGVIFADTDSILMLLKEKNATNAIVIKNYNAFFYQDDVEVTKSPEGTSRIARYDICSEITYLYYNNSWLIDSTPIRICQFYSTRSVASGLLAAGPNIVSNKKEAIEITRQNVERYFYTFHRH